MARKEMNRGEGTEQPWGTLEELLLACAVNRYGSESWDSIATELQRRASHHHLRAFYSPPICKRKYHDLRRRFAAGASGDGDGEITMVDELKKLRVAELRREVERHDVSIEFLQLKVKRLEGQRGRSFKPKEEVKQEEEETDLPDGREPEGNSGRSVAGEDSGNGDNRSFNESNSTSNQKDLNREEDGDGLGLKHKPVEPETRKHKPEPVSYPFGLCNSVAESKLSREVHCSRKNKLRGRSRFPIVSSSGEDEPEGKQVPVESKLLSKILETIRSHRNGSLFERRLRSQETERYKKMIRQPMDLQTVQSMLDKGSYLDFPHKLYRDLLLIFTNATVFFPNTSSQHVAALELREIVTKEMAQTIPINHPKLDPNKKQPDRTQKQPVNPPPIVVCRRRNLSNREVVVEAKVKQPEKKQNPNRVLGGNNKVRSEGRTQKVRDVKNDSDHDDEIDKGKRRQRGGARERGRSGGGGRGVGDGKRGRPPKRSLAAKDSRRDNGGRGKRGHEVAADPGRPRKRSRS